MFTWKTNISLFCLITKILIYIYLCIGNYCNGNGTDLKCKYIKFHWIKQKGAQKKVEKSINSTIVFNVRYIST